jgi:hypothetical protein
VEKFFQDYQGEPDDMIRRIHQLVEVQQTREQVMNRAHHYQQKIKQDFDRKVRKEDFQLGDLVLKWDVPKQDKGKHVNLIPCGSVPSKSLRGFQIILTGCRIWRVMKFLVAL